MSENYSSRSVNGAPAGRAWVAVGDHWEWFRRVAAARKERETDPVLPLLDGSRDAAAISAAMAAAGQVPANLDALLAALARAGLLCA